MLPYHWVIRRITMITNSRPRHLPWWLDWECVNSLCTNQALCLFKRLTLEFLLGSVWLQREAPRWSALLLCWQKHFPRELKCEPGRCSPREAHGEQAALLQGLPSACWRTRLQGRPCDVPLFWPTYAHHVAPDTMAWFTLNCLLSPGPQREK